MEISKLKGEDRKAGGSRAADRLRKAGKLPCVVYGHGQEPEHIAVGRSDLENLLGHGAQVVELSIDDKASPVLIKDVQYDHLGMAMVHVDLMRVSLDERIKVSVALEFRGTPVGVVAGGLFEENLVEIEVECPATHIPDSIRVNVGDLKLGQMLHVKDITLPPNAKAVTPADAIVCAVRIKATAEVEEVAPEGEATGPEIITARARDEEAEEEKEKKKK